MNISPLRRIDVPAFAIGTGLIALAGVVVWDTGRMTIGATYGIGPEAMPYVLGAFLALLGVAHLVSALREARPEPEETDLGAIGWIGAALFGLLAAIGLGGGFVLGTAILFAFTARAFGRRALLLDLGIGLVLGVLIFLVFNDLLTLTLPQGPVERLL
ncbi:tripartite tricarboxylate transporter TctB family protein [Ancylobacter oerskovii]|uniref:Tripartite tricarboxylate transporter TctB family protein n=1 Tax=Ancylobacter oerskovii TaxID=459519 RepID=A0ABW4YVS1_9HYPH|nr:tripartite tricarboxylate transporter TctB family protein [Ancylobacter oerskovii]MBS7544158.1 tripartite tricarboxylate transporter TctB family protein [Ancylobacter oerskovii]